MKNETTVIELRQRRSDIIQRIKELDSKLIALRTQARTSGRMRNGDYRSLCNDQRTWIQEKGELEVELGRIKTQISYEHENGNRSNGSSVELKPVVQQLVELRHKYQQFAADGSRVSSMRRMAAEFVMELNPIIKDGIRAQPD
jgi:hypothetical protein